MGEVDEVLEKQKSQRTDWLMLSIIGVTILSAVAVKVFYGTPYSEFVKTYGLTVMLLFIIFTGVSISKWNDIFTKNSNLLMIAGYTCGLILIIASVKYPIYNLWFIGGVLIGIMVNEYLGIAMQFILAYLYCGLNGHNIERMLFYFILGAIICFLGKYLYKASTAIYVIIIVLSCNVIFLFVMNSFVFRDSLNENTVYSVASTFAVMIVMYGIMAVKGIKPAGLVKLEEEEALEAKRKAEKEILAGEQQKASKPLSAQELRQIEIEMVEPKEAIYDTILDENYELLQQLKEKSPSLFAHSKKVAELAANGAVILGCSEKIAKAGGLYHEIGRLKSKDYIVDGAALLEERHFPQEVIDVIKQHNAKTEKPKSKEAAIVMLSESVVSTVTYLAKEKKKALAEGREYKEQPIPKMVENIFDIRFSKGSLDESGITILEYKKLKNYYLGIYSK